MEPHAGAGGRVSRVAPFIWLVILTPMWLVLILLLRSGVIPGLGVGYYRTTLMKAAATVAGTVDVGVGQQNPLVRDAVPHLQKGLVERVRNNPRLLDPKEGGPELLRRFEAAPWLLPPRTKALPYAGVHDMDRLLSLRAKPQGALNRTITIVLLTRNMAVMTQNCIYTMVKWGRVNNYIVGTVGQEDFEACLDLNLPCVDVSFLLPLPLNKEEEEGGQVEQMNPGSYGFGQYNYYVLTFLRPAIVLHLLRKGFAVHNSDSDIAYGPHPVWPSYTNLLAASAADMAATFEDNWINGGNYVVLPNPRTVTMFKGWVATAKKSCNPPEGQDMMHDQDALRSLYDQLWQQCKHPAECKQLLTDMRTNNQSMAVVRSFWPAQWFDYPDHCAFGNPNDVPTIDPCHMSAVFIHPVCQGDHAMKRASLVNVGFWFMDDAEGGCQPDKSSVSGVPRCELLRWRQPQTEDRFLACQHGLLGFTLKRASSVEQSISARGGSAAFPLKPIQL